nr:putative ribonuclease H-like domain-containing protein [Tanacetum cinerariifolium]
MPPKRTLTSAAPAITQATIRQLIADSITTALKAQAANMANADNTNRNPEPRKAPVARNYSYKEFMSCQPLNFKGSEGVVGLIRCFERTESVFSCSNYTEDYKVKFATGTLTEEALSWWNSFAPPTEIEEDYKITWVKLKKLLIKKYYLRTEGDYEMWRLRIEQYFQVQDYALWDVIENDNSFKPVPQTIANADAIQARFNDNDATKKTQRTLLKQMYENFNAPSTECFDSIFNMLQKIISQLAIMGENISQEDLNTKFLKSLPSEWNTHVVVWRNKAYLDPMRIDDLYSNFKIVEQEVKRKVASSSRSPNMAFLSSPGSTSEADTASIQVSAVSTPVSTVNLEQIHEDDLKEMDLKWRLALLSMRARRNQESSRKTLNVEDISSKAMVAINGVGFDWSYMVDDEVPTNMALMAFSDSEEFQHPEFKGYGSKDSKSVCIDTSNEIKKAPDAPIIEDWVSVSDEDESEEIVLKSDNVQHKLEQANQPRKMVQKLVLKNVEKRTVQREDRPVWNNAMRNNHKNFSNSRRNFAPIAVLTKSGIVPISTARQSSSRAAAPVSAARPINTAASKLLVNVAKPRQNALQTTHSLSRRPFYQQTALKNRNLNNNVNVAKANSVNTAKGNKVTSVFGNQGINVVMPSSCWVWRPKIKVQYHVSKNSGSYICKRFDYADPEGRLNGCSKHMTGNISYLADFKEHDGGYVAFVGGAKGGKITEKAPSKLNRVMNEFYEEKGIKMEYGVARTPPQNEVAERRNRTLIDAARTMLADSKLPTTFWAETVSTACYVQNRRPNVESNTKTVNTIGPFNTTTSTYADYPNDPLMPDLEDARIFDDAYDDRDKGAEAEYNNLEKLFLAYASFMDFTVYQMDVKSTFLYGTIEEEVYVSQPPGFVDPKFLDRVYKVEKALYGLHQAPRAWYETLSTYLLDNGFIRGIIDKTLFIKKIKGDILLVQVYVDDIIFGFIKRSLRLELKGYLINDGYSDLVQHVDKKELDIPGQTETGKELSNLLMAGSLPKTTFPTKLTSAKVKKVNDEVRIQALVYGKRVNIKESSIRRILKLDDAEGTRFSGEVTLLFDNMLVQAPEEVGILQADAQPIPIPTEPSTSKPQKKHKPKRKHTKEPEVPPTESQVEHNVPLLLPSYDPLPSGEDSLKLKELMDFCTNLSNKVLDLESEVIDIKSTYKAKIKKLESRVERLEEDNRVLKELNELDHQERVLSMLDVNDEEPAGVEEVLEVVTAAKLIIKVVTTVRVDVNAASVQDTPITATKVTKVIDEVTKPRKRRDEEVTRQLEKELNADINWNAVIEKVKRSERITDARRESLWKIVRERFEKTEPKNYTDDYLLNTLKIMFEKPNIKANVWKDQKGKYGLAKVKSWKLFDSCGVQCLNLSTTHIFLLVEKMYPLTHFTLEQMVNDVILKVDYESEMSLELLRLVRRLLNEGYVPQ